MLNHESGNATSVGSKIYPLFRDWKDDNSVRRATIGPQNSLCNLDDDEVFSQRSKGAKLLPDFYVFLIYTSNNIHQLRYSDNSEPYNLKRPN